MRPEAERLCLVSQRSGSSRRSSIQRRRAFFISAAEERALVAAIDAQLVDVEAQRGPSVEGLPEDLLALYEKLRANKGGVGAAMGKKRRR